MHACACMNLFPARTRACVSYARKLDINNTKTAQYEILEHVEQDYYGSGKYLDKKRETAEVPKFTGN